MGIEHPRASIRSLRRCFRPASLLRDLCWGFGLLRGSGCGFFRDLCWGFGLLRGSGCGLLRDLCWGFGLLHGLDRGDAEHLVEAGGL
jgi:hypothetical protein